MKRFAWILPLAAALAVYSIAPLGGLVWDDQLVARQQMAVFRSFADVLVPPPDIPQWTYAYYRPVVVLSYVLDQALFGRGAAAGPHAMNVVYHLLATAGVWALAARLFAGRAHAAGAAVVAATLFAVHPIHVESVSWITGRSDVLATLFLLPALVLVLRWRDGGSWPALLLAALLFLAACLAKEVALAGLLLAPLLLWATRPAGGARPPATAIIVGTLPWFAAAGLYAWLRSAAGTGGASLAPGSPAELAAKLVRAAGFYLGKLAWPWPQSHFLPWDLVPGVTTAAPVVAVALGLGFLAWRSRGAPALAAALWVPITVAPALAIAATSVAATPVAERYLYLPSVGFALLAGFAWDAAASRWRPLAAAVLALAGAATLERGRAWQDDLRLWSSVVSATDCCVLPFIEYGKAQYLAGDAKGAELTFRRARGIPDEPHLQAIVAYNLGTLAVRRGELREGIAEFEQAIALNPAYALPRYGLGRAAYELGLGAQLAGDATRATALFGRALDRHGEALRLNPAQASAHLERARVLASLAALARDEAPARYRAALDDIEAAARLEPAVLERPEVRELRGRVLAGLREARP